MEFFEGKRLSEAILGDETDFISLNEKSKTNIILQLCKAFSFLHLQENPIIHRDVKLENIMVNAEGIIKVCDFGLSTFLTAATSLRTTIGKKVPGTFVYFAPELVLKQESASTRSDVWAIASIIVEIYREEPIWNELDEESIKNNLAAGVLPNLDRVPEYMLTVIRKCFSSDPFQRPSVFEVFREIHKYKCN